MANRWNTAQTPVRSIRIPDDIWQAAQQRAVAENTTISEVVVNLLRSYAE